MIDLKRTNRRMQSAEDALREGETQHPHLSRATMAWVAVGSAVLGAGTSIYGANQQKKANQSAQNQNAALQREQNDAAWSNWLMTRGVAPTTPVSAGVMPTAGNSTAVNTRLPYWATVNVQSQPGSLRVVRRGTAAPRPALTPAPL